MPLTVNKDFLPLYKNEAIMSLLQALPTCASYVMWIQSLCSDGCEDEAAVSRSLILRRAQL